MQLSRLRYFAATLMATLLSRSLLVRDSEVFFQLDVSAIALVAMLLAAITVPGFVRAKVDRSMALGVVLGLPLSFFMGQIVAGGAAGNSGLVSGAYRVLGLSAVLMVALEAWSIYRFSKEQSKAS